MSTIVMLYTHEYHLMLYTYLLTNTIFMLYTYEYNLCTRYSSVQALYYIQQMSSIYYTTRDN